MDMLSIRSMTKVELAGFGLKATRKAPLPGWRPARRLKPRTDRRAERVHLRLLPREMALLRRAAEAAGVPWTRWCRENLLLAAKGQAAFTEELARSIVRELFGRRLDYAPRDRW